LLKKLLITGGCGYIGSHTIVTLINADYDVIVYDNLSNSSIDILTKIFQITGKVIDFVKGDIRDTDKLEKVFEENKIDGVIHFAGLKSVYESINDPNLYYDNNVIGSIRLLQLIKKFNVKAFIYSSSATVYGEHNNSPLLERLFLKLPENPYGSSKLMVEKIISDFQKSNSDFNVICLRYFNPVGAHPSGLIGENLKSKKPNNLMPLITQTAFGKHKFLPVFGNDYPTKDGTPIRDYIHVSDIADGHLAAIKKCDDKFGFKTLNLGTGKGYSVIEVINTFKKVNKINVPYEIVGRRPGDVAENYADVSLAKSFLKWKAKNDLDQMCKDSWNWQLSSEKSK